MEAAGTIRVRHRSRADRFRLWYLSDLHWLSAACAEQQIRRDIEVIRDDPYSLWVGGGDYAEFIGYQDRRFDPDAVCKRVSVADLGQLGDLAYREVRDLFAPIADKCLGLIEGNHERQYTRAMQQRDRQGWLCSELQVPNLGYSAIFDLAFDRSSTTELPAISPPLKSKRAVKTFRVFCHHGAGYAQTKGGKLNRLSAFMSMFDADIYLLGHVHDQTGTRETVIGADRSCARLTERHRIGVISGGYLKTYSQGVTTYGEQRGYRPTVLGAAWVDITPSTRHLEGRI